MRRWTLVSRSHFTARLANARCDSTIFLRVGSLRFLGYHHLTPSNTSRTQHRVRILENLTPCLACILRRAESSDPLLSKTYQQKMLLRGHSQGFTELRRHRVYLVPFKEDLKLLRILVIALQHADLRNVWESQLRSEDALLKSAASRRPRSIAGIISPPGSALTDTPMAVNMSIEIPTVRYLRPFMSSILVTGFLNQPRGWVGIGPYT